MNVTPVNLTSFGKVHLKDDKGTKKVLKDFITDVDSADFFRKSFKELDTASENRDIELSAKKGKSMYIFCLKEQNSTKDQMIAVPIDNVKLMCERRRHFESIMHKLTNFTERW